MARNRTHQLLLSEAEFTWLQKVTPRHLKHIEMKHEAGDKNVTKKRLSAMRALVEKLSAPPTETFEEKLVFASNRQDVRLLEEMVGVEYGALITRVIPNYAERLPADRSRYEPYHEAAIARSKLLLGLLNQIKERVS